MTKGGGGGVRNGKVREGHDRQSVGKRGECINSGGREWQKEGERMSRGQKSLKLTWTETDNRNIQETTD